MKDIINSKIKKNQIIVDSMDSQIEELGKRRSEIEEALKVIEEANVTEIFKDVVDEFGYVIKQNYGGSFSFFANTQKDTGRFNALFTLYSRYNYSREFEKSLNYYTSTCDSDFEFTRLEAVGKVAKIVKAFSAEELFDAIRVGSGELVAEDKELQDKQMALRSVSREAAKTIERLQQELVEIDLTADGVEFEKPFNLMVGRKIDTYDVVKVKITKKSTSGKTCDVQVTKQGFEYDHDKQEWKKEPKLYNVTYDRVKTKDLIWNIQYYKEKQLKELAKTAS